MPIGPAQVSARNRVSAILPPLVDMNCFARLYTRGYIKIKRRKKHEVVFNSLIPVIVTQARLWLSQMLQETVLLSLELDN
jgi:hypothetical protein